MLQKSLLFAVFVLFFSSDLLFAFEGETEKQSAEFKYDFKAKKSENGLYGVVDGKGKWVIPPKYDSTYGFNTEVWKKNNLKFDAIVFVKKNRKCGGVNLKNEIVIPVIYDRIGPFPLKCNVGYASISINKKWGVIDLKGKVIIQPIYDGGWRFSEGLISRKKDGKWGFLNDKEETIIPFKYAGAIEFVGGLAPVTLDGKKWGYINKKDEWIIKPQFEKAKRFSEGFAGVCIDGLWGYVDAKGKMVVKPQFLRVYKFGKNGVARVAINNLSGRRGAYYINKKGDYLQGGSEFGIGCA